jgi:C-terminal processing protease CtpA/Prc
LLSVAVPRARGKPESLISSREVEGVPVVCIRRWSDAEGVKLIERFDTELERWRNRPGLILDVRGNGGGSDGLAEAVMGRFLQAPIIASISFQRRPPGQIFERLVATAAPRGPWRYAGRVAVLTDEGCKSACEHFVSGMIEAGALACGTPTSGCCGWIRTVELPGGAKLHVARTYPLHTGGVPSPLLGIPPHLWAPRTLEDVRAGRDTALEAALRWVRSSAPLPLRLQPVAPLAR